MKKLIIIFSILCFGAAALLLILMPKPEKSLPTLPDANYTYTVNGAEFHENGLRKIVSVPVVTDLSYSYFEGTRTIGKLNNSDFDELCPSFEDGDSVTYMLNICNVTLTAGDFISYRLEGSFVNATTNYRDFILTSHNIDFTTGDEITFEDVVSELSKFEKAFARGRFTLVKSDNSAYAESSAEMLGNYAPLNGIYPDWYVDAEYFYVIAKAPAVMGGLTEYKIPLLDAAEFLNMENELVKMIFTGK